MTTLGLQLPYGLQPVNPAPVDAWSGPYYGEDENEAKSQANSSIPIGVRFQSMEVRLIINGISKKYWYRDGTEDIDLVEFSSSSDVTLIQQQIDVLSLDISNILSRIENLSPGVGTKIAMNVVPSGVIDGSNKVFSLNSVPTPASSLMFFVNGQLLSQGEDKDFVLSGSTVTLANAPIPDDVIFAMYSYQTEVISYSINEPITIEINGLESNITLQNEPQPSSSLMLFMNGQLLTQNEDYVLISKNITLGQHLDEIESSTFFATYSY